MQLDRNICKECGEKNFSDSGYYHAQGLCNDCFKKSQMNLLQLEDEIVVTDFEGNPFDENKMDLIKQYNIPDDLGKVIALYSEFDVQWKQTFISSFFLIMTLPFILEILSNGFSWISAFVIILFPSISFFIFFIDKDIELIGTKGFGHITKYKNGYKEEYIYKYQDIAKVDIKKVPLYPNEYMFFDYNHKLICSGSSDYYKLARNYWKNKNILNDQ